MKNNLFNPPKYVEMSLVGVDGNAFVIMGTFRKNALKQGWTKEEVNLVLDKAKESDYANLLSTILAHCNNEDS